MADATEITRDDLLAEDSRALPSSKACADCIHFKRCSWLVGAKPDWRHCDFFPVKFHEAPKEVSNG